MEKKRTFKHLDYTQRCRLKEMLDNGTSVQDIADELGFHRSAIYREIKTGTIAGEYNPEYAQKRADALLVVNKRKSIIDSNDKLAQCIADLILQKNMSPERIVEWFKENDHAFSSYPTSPNTIYTAIDNGSIPGVSRENLNSCETTMFNDMIRFPD